MEKSRSVNGTLDLNFPAKMEKSRSVKGTLDLNLPAVSKWNCELCHAEAAVYCASDSAHLCWTCDAKVHNANFLVSRHIRSIICSNCRNLADFRISGAGISLESGNLCRSCSPEGDVVADDGGSLSSSSSSCVSSTTEETTSRRMRRSEKKIGGGGGAVAVDFKVEGILINWCRRMSLDDRKSLEVVTTAVEVLSGCLGKMTCFPFRVSLATSFWVAMRVLRLVVGSETCRDLRRLEQISGVPAKLILATESRLARAIKRRQSRDDHEEGWAES